MTLQRTAEEIAEGSVAAGFEAKPYHAGLDDSAIARRKIGSSPRSGESSSPRSRSAWASINPISAPSFITICPKHSKTTPRKSAAQGRDGALAVCEVFAAAEDVRHSRKLSYGDTPTSSAIAAFLDEILDADVDFEVSLYDLSNRHNVRPLVIQTILTYLELEGIISSVGSSYAGCKIQFLTPVAEFLASFDARRSRFLSDLFAQGRQGPKWLTLDTAGAAAGLGEPRERVISALNYLEEQGHVVSNPRAGGNGSDAWLTRSIARGWLPC